MFPNILFYHPKEILSNFAQAEACATGVLGNFCPKRPHSLMLNYSERKLLTGLANAALIA